ncbi:hypothetical protein GCM10010252_04580 [Streptomyces aureoverticillatus]|nr:hypothetical protein GCM10010252_04580 [Streptomyces aureoverticillatus]
MYAKGNAGQAGRLVTGARANFTVDPEFLEAPAPGAEQPGHGLPCDTKATLRDLGGDTLKPSPNDPRQTPKVAHRDRAAHQP